MLLSVFLNFQNHLEQLGKIFDVQLASLSCRQKQKKHSGSADDQSSKKFIIIILHSSH